jgi:hypothetical protein
MTYNKKSPSTILPSQDQVLQHLGIKNRPNFSQLYRVFFCLHLRLVRISSCISSLLTCGCKIFCQGRDVRGRGRHSFCRSAKLSSIDRSRLTKSRSSETVTMVTSTDLFNCIGEFVYPGDFLEHPRNIHGIHHYPSPLIRIFAYERKK